MSLLQEWQKPTPLGQNVEAGRSSPDRGFISDLAFSGDGKHLLAASSNGEVYLFNPNNQKLRTVVSTSDNAALKVLFVGEWYFTTASTDNCIMLWDMRNTHQAINSLRGHKNVIRTLDYHKPTGKLISSSYDGDVRYWHVGSYQVEREEVDREENANYRGILLKCTDLNRIAINWCSEKLLLVTSKGVIFSISNLSIDHLKNDIPYARLDDTLPLLLSWITPNTSTNRRNTIRIIHSNDYSVNPQFTVSKIHHLTTHPVLPLALIRFSGTQKTLYSNKMKDWTTIYRLDQTIPVDDNVICDTLRAYGTDIVEENLIFASEETRYATMFEKRSCFSKCGRVVASPHKTGVRLLAFSEQLDTPLLARKAHPDNFSVLSASSLWCDEPSSMCVVATIARETDSVMCAQFSEAGSGFLLALGEMEGRVSFHQPHL
jgi:WD40 repeat protein